ncbi:MAG: serine/threonine protein kinase [Deltaproteobacteria bacterium]|nr:serine/threonine protein kinase [Deltaproteobacteria bacterium]
MEPAPPPSEVQGLPVQPGALILGKYSVERVLGVGGMGVVVRAKHLALGQSVAIKFLRSDRPAGEEAEARFIREARAASRLQSEHVARVLDVGRLDSGDPYMVLEFLEGRDLAQIVASSGPLPCSQAVDCVLQACAAVADAHALGIVHRDLKPANLFVTRRTDGSPFIKVLDFGISKITGSGKGASFQGDLTQPAVMMGSPLYMSPEQMRNAKDVDARSDVWALGGILFELLAGKPAFDSRSLTELCARITSEPTPSLRGLRPEVPAGIEEVVNRCLEKDPAKRFQNVADLAVALGPFASMENLALVQRIVGVLRVAGVSAPTGGNTATMGSPPSIRNLPAIPGASTTRSWVVPASLGPRARWALIAVALAAAIATLVVGIVRYIDRRQPSAGLVPVLEVDHIARGTSASASASAELASDAAPAAASSAVASASPDAPRTPASATSSPGSPKPPGVGQPGVRNPPGAPTGTTTVRGIDPNERL